MIFSSKTMNLNIKNAVGFLTFEKFDDIDFDKLPDQFVMKCTHACAFNQIVRDKKNFNKDEARKKFNKWLKTNYGNKTLEKHYSKIKPQIIIEKYIGEIPRKSDNRNCR